MGKFIGVIQLQVIPGDGTHWLVAESFFYTTSAGETIVVDKGLETDLASTPRIVWGIYPPFGLYTGAAIVHDQLYTKGTFERAKCDAILLEAMETERVSWITRHIIYRAVRMFGWFAWDQHRKHDYTAPPIN